MQEEHPAGSIGYCHPNNPTDLRRCNDAGDVRSVAVGVVRRGARTAGSAAASGPGLQAGAGKVPAVDVINVTCRDHEGGDVGVAAGKVLALPMPLAVPIRGNIASLWFPSSSMPLPGIPGI